MNDGTERFMKLIREDHISISQLYHDTIRRALLKLNPNADILTTAVGSAVTHDINYYPDGTSVGGASHHFKPVLGPNAMAAKIIHDVETKDAKTIEEEFFRVHYDYFQLDSDATPEKKENIRRLAKRENEDAK